MLHLVASKIAATVNDLFVLRLGERGGAGSEPATASSVPAVAVAPTFAAGRAFKTAFSQRTHRF